MDGLLERREELKGQQTPIVPNSTIMVSGDASADLAVTNISPDKQQDVEIMNEILKKGPFNTPEELIQEIANFLNEKLDYDPITKLLFVANNPEAVRAMAQSNNRE
ncbi:MAG: hypothetical protein LBD88_00665 [Candidatus Peribacteria bacterium]|nr:hypothetical protein [Candidatus Peribacteria bacterium]